MEFIGQLFLVQLGRPQLLIGGAAHGCGQMVIDLGTEAFQLADMFFDVLTLGMAVVRAGIAQRLQFKLADVFDDLAFAVIQQRPQYGQAGLRQRCDR